MAFLGDEPEAEHELTTERVPGGRRAAFIVGVAAVLIVGTLVWKPWDTSSPGPSPRPSTAIVAVAPTAAPTSTPIPTLTPPSPPQPKLADLGPQPQAFRAPGSLGQVLLFANSTGTGGPGAWCIYRSGQVSNRPRLVLVVVEPPVIEAGTALRTGQLHSVSWHVDLESNTQDKIFYADWASLGSSAATTADLASGEYAFAKPISVNIKRLSSITILRTSMVVDWLGGSGQVLAEQVFTTTTYGALGASTESAAGGCAATI